MATIGTTGGLKGIAHIQEIKRRLKGGRTIRSGFLEGSTDENGVSNPLKAAINEFGAPDRNIPPRPFMRPASKVIEKDGGDWLGPLLVANDYDVEKALDAVGFFMDDAIRLAIIDVTEPPLSDITIMLRWMKSQNPDLVVTGATVGEASRRVAAGGLADIGAVNTKPLEDTKAMYRSVDHEIEP